MAIGNGAAAEQLSENLQGEAKIAFDAACRAVEVVPDDGERTRTASGIVVALRASLRMEAGETSASVDEYGVVGTTYHEGNVGTQGGGAP